MDRCGGLGGYRFSQIVAQVMTALAHLGWARPPALNYSSMTAISTTRIDMESGNTVSGSMTSTYWQ